MKKFLAVLLCVCMTASLCVVGVGATPATTDVAAIGETGYATLADAVAAAKTGDTVELLCNVKDGTGVIVSGTANRSFTIDFNGFGYNVSQDPLAGSTGTKNQCFQLLKGSTITMKNGTLTASSANIRMIVQNYCNLTLEDMTIDASNGGNNAAYALSNNCGAVNIKGNTTIRAKTGQVAFDACWAPNNGYPEGTQVTVDTTGEIDGTIEFDLWGTNAKPCLTTLKIVNCRMNGGFSTSTLGAEAEKNITISGGKFSSDPTAYVASDCFAVDNTDSDSATYPFLVSSTGVASIGGTQYATLADAVAAAKTGDTVELLRSVKSGTGVIVSGTDNRSFTIDFNGFGYNVSRDPLAGSTGTKNQCFQLLKGSTITMKNGTLTASSANIRMIVQNYCNLTLEDMTIDASTGGNNAAYALSNNCGAVNITGNTTIRAKTGQVAFDACWAPNKGYPEGTQVTVDTTGEIDGTIEFDLWGTNAEPCLTTLKIVNCRMNGGFSTSTLEAEAKTNITISGGYFTSDPGAYAAAGYKSTGGSWTVGGSAYNYKVSAVPSVKIQTVSASAIIKDIDEPDTDNEVAAALNGSTIVVSGKLPAADTEVEVNYINTDGTHGTVTFARDATTGAFVQPAPFKVGSTTYSIDISRLTDLPADVTTGEPAVQPVPSPTGATNPKAAQDAADAINKALDPKESEAPVAVSADGLGAAAANTINTTGSGTGEQTTVPVGNASGGKTTEDVQQVIGDARGDNNAPAAIKEADPGDLVVVVQPVLNIKVKDAATDENGKKTITLDITASTQAVVTKKDTAGGSEKLDDKNSVKVGDPAPMTVNNDVTLTIPVPRGFATDTNKDNIFIKHTMHSGIIENVKATVSEKKYDDNSYAAITFTVHGLSPMTIVTDTRTATVEFPNDTHAYDFSDVGKALPTATQAGSTFDGWTFIGINGTYKTMTDDLLNKLDGKTVTAAPVFTKNSAPSAPTGGTGTTTDAKTFTVTAAAAANGTLSPAGKTTVKSGESQTYTIKPADGYKISDVLVDGKSVGALTTYTFSNVTADHTISAAFEKTATAPAEWTNPFSDVGTGDWFYDAVKYVNQHGLFSGSTPTTFSPTAPITRQQMWMVIARMSGASPANYAEARAWAMANKISDGTNPGSVITREQFAAMLYRYAQLKGYDTTQGGMAVREFADYSSISAYALAPMTWAVNAGLLQGSSNMLTPKNNTTRAQSATILMRFCENIVK